MTPKEVEELTGTMVFHVSAAVVLARNLSRALGPSGVVLMNALLSDTIKDADSAHEEAFWLSLRDFFDPDINPELREGPEDPGDGDNNLLHYRMKVH